MRWTLCILILATGLFTRTEAQDFGGFSPDIVWKQINTKPVRVIFPEGLENQANRVASLVNYMHVNNRTTIGNKFKKLDLVLNNQGIIPNGYVGFMPFRSEFFTTPFQQSEELGSLPWLDLLSVHEYRHALQFSNFHRGITKVGYLLMGEIFWGVALNLSTPNWFFEGDAIMTETALTKQGRGRIPGYNQTYQSILSARNPLTYQKARNGSFRTEVPDHYRLGYLLCSYGREQYGDDLWMNVLDRTARFKGIIYPFSKGIKHYTGLKSRQFYKEAMDYYQQKWDSISQNHQADESERLTQNFRTVTHYAYPEWDASTQAWLAVKSSFKYREAIYRITPDGKEEKIVDLGMHLDPVFSSGANFITWAELSWDPRFSTISYSDIVLYNRQTERKTYLSKQKSYFSPALSRDETKIVVVETNKIGEYALTIMDASTGHVVQTIPNPENLYYTYPQWSLDDNYIYAAARHQDGKMSIIRMNPDTGDYTFVIQPSNHLFGKIALANDQMYFAATYEGKRNIFSYHFQTHALKRLTNSEFGAKNPAVNAQNTSVCYADYSHTGQFLNTIATGSIFSNRVNTTDLHHLENETKKYAVIEGGSMLEKFDIQDFESRRYHPELHSMKLHSWSPVVTTSTLGLSLTSDNIFNNIHLEGGYSYYLNEQSGGYAVNAVYGRYFPIVSLGFSQGFRNPGFDIDDHLKVWERSITGGVEIPLDFSKGLYNRGFSGGIRLQNTAVPENPGLENLGSQKMNFTSIGVSNVFTISKLRAKQNITTPLGVGGEFHFQKSISETTASQFQLFTDVAVRGIFPNHNLVIGFSYKRENRWNDYQYLDLNIYPRGFEIPANDWMATWQFNYHFPILYPDFGFGGLIYFSRLRGNFFMDVAIGQTLDPSTDQMGIHPFQSVGVEIITDMTWIHLLPVSIGVRATALAVSDHNNPGRSSYVELFFPVLRL